MAAFPNGCVRPIRDLAIVFGCPGSWHNAEMSARDDSSISIPRLLVRPGLCNKLRALQYRWILMLTAQVVGFRTAVRVARLAGRFLSNNIPLLSTEVRETIAAALPTTHTSNEINAITQKYATDVWINFIETEYVHRLMSAATVEQVVRCGPGVDRLVETIRAGRGVVGAGAYFGNHQVGMTALGLLLKGRVSGIISPVQHSTQQRWMAGMVRRKLARLVPRGDAMSGTALALRAGYLALIISEYSSNRRNAIEVEFLGKRHRFHPSAALLAWRTRSPLAVLTCHRLDDEFRFEMRVREWLEPPARGGREWSREATVRVISSLESAIVERPDQYAWMHRHVLAGRTRE